jgi:hypothetical protein
MPINCNIIHKTLIQATVTIPIEVEYTYDPGYGGDPECPPHPAEVHILTATINNELALCAITEDESNMFEMESLTLDQHEE